MQDAIWVCWEDLLVVPFPIRKHDFHTKYLNMQRYLNICYLLLSQKKQLQKLKEDKEMSTSEQFVRVAEFPGLWRYSMGTNAGIHSLRSHCT